MIRLNRCQKRRNRIQDDNNPKASSTRIPTVPIPGYESALNLTTEFGTKTEEVSVNTKYIVYFAPFFIFIGNKQGNSKIIQCNIFMIADT